MSKIMDTAKPCLVRTLSSLKWRPKTGQVVKALIWAIYRGIFMCKKRKQYGRNFKVKMALAAMRGDKALPQLAARHGLHPIQINSWKRRLVDHAAELFIQGNGARKGPAPPADDLQQELNQLTVARDFLAGKYNHQVLSGAK